MFRIVYGVISEDEIISRYIIPTFVCEQHRRYPKGLVKIIDTVAFLFYFWKWYFGIEIDLGRRDIYVY